MILQPKQSDFKLWVSNQWNGHEVGGILRCEWSKNWVMETLNKEYFDDEIKRLEIEENWWERRWNLLEKDLSGRIKDN